eukprot:CAMPEP_0205820144 /NCGR_PEP_ID=MMETSP0206-20130828/2750_1 /ASSEMBLY_ACC=CAM_ASM_000279 /TAXON_ID=36767 /ORGANISM="Euplotes focardii, Strain TN1" /LENGTH=152 /DNA_ID=CAMNT_0053114571 /DNA_START=34 /DNA_END=492 /DNA_ORIENTATION=+
MTTIGTINEEGVNVDLYIPRKCHASNTLIPAYDYAAVQLNIGDVDSNGVYTGTTRTMCIAGFLRSQAESDHAVNRLCITHGVIRARPCKPKKQKKNLPKAAQKKAQAPKKGGQAPKKGGQAPRKPQQGDRKPRQQGDRKPQGERKPRAPKKE